jgi:hypothetical protein
MFTLIALAFLPLAMTIRAMWVKRRFWTSSAGASSSRGWFWEASYFEFYRSSFKDEFPHWLPVTLYVSTPLFAIIKFHTSTALSVWVCS